MIKLSVLDQSIAVTGKPEDQTIRDTIALARLCDDLGFHRFWLSEHHNHPTILGTAPEITMAAIAQVTSRIRIGSAGIMLPHYSPFKVAEQFRVLDAIAPGRIDMGLGRAPGSDGLTGQALNPNGRSNSENFPQNVDDLMAWVSGQPLADQHPYRSLQAHPKSSTSPEAWMLGTSDYGARLAAHFGMPYCFAYFITDGQGAQRALDVYHQNYQPSERFPEPLASICVWALAAGSEAEASHIFKPRLHWKLTRDQGGIEPLHPPEFVDTFEYAQQEKMILQRLRSEAIVGTSEQVATSLKSLASTFEVDEVVVLTWAFDEADRRNSYQLLSEAFDLQASTG